MHTDQLFALIKTFTPQNKKAVSLYIKQHYKSNLPNYIQLYKLYLKLINENHDDEAIEFILKERLKRKPYLLKHIANNRRLLKEHLFSILLASENEGNAEQEIEDAIRIIKILIERKLYEFAKKIIDKVKEQAVAFDLNKKLIDLMRLELELVWKGSSKDDLIRQLALIKQLEKCVQLYAKEIQFESFFRKLSLLAERDAMNLKEENRSNLEAAYYQNQVEQFDVKAHESNNNIRLIYWYCRIQSLYFRLMGKPEQALNFNQKLVECFEQDAKRKDNFELLYLKSICSYTRACRANNNFSALEKSLKKVRQIYGLKGNYDALQVTCNIGVLHYLSQKQYAKAEVITNLMEQEWTNITSNSSDGRRLWYCHSNIIFFWIIGDTLKFEYWLNHGLDIPRSNKGRGYYFGIRMLSLMADLDNHQLHAFKTKLEAFQKTLKNNEHLTAFEKMVLDYFRILYNNESNNKHNQKEKAELKKENFLLLKEELLELKFSSKPINYEEILLWCESHLQNKTIKEVFEAENNTGTEK